MKAFKAQVEVSQVDDFLTSKNLCVRFVQTPQENISPENEEIKIKGSLLEMYLKRDGNTIKPGAEYYVHLVPK